MPNVLSDQFGYLKNAPKTSISFNMVNKLVSQAICSKVEFVLVNLVNRHRYDNLGQLLWLQCLETSIVNSVLKMP